MANTSSAKKAIRAQGRKHAQNLSRKRNMRDARKDVREAQKANDQKLTVTSLANFQKAVDKAAKTGAIHKNAAARYKSRLAKQINQSASK